MTKKWKDTEFKREKEWTFRGGTRFEVSDEMDRGFLLYEIDKRDAEIAELVAMLEQALGDTMSLEDAHALVAKLKEKP